MGDGTDENIKTINVNPEIKRWKEKRQPKNDFLKNVCENGSVNNITTKGNNTLVSKQSKDSIFFNLFILLFLTVGFL